jgi:hypothetical protein
MDVQQELGYKDISPFNKLPFQTFNTDTLTMRGVSVPILAIPNKGKPIVMKPNTGEYKFKNATEILEIPIRQDGGVSTLPLPKVINSDNMFYKQDINFLDSKSLYKEMYRGTAAKHFYPDELNNEIYLNLKPQEKKAFKRRLENFKKDFKLVHQPNTKNWVVTSDVDYLLNDKHIERNMPELLSNIKTLLTGERADTSYVNPDEGVKNMQDGGSLFGEAGSFIGDTNKNYYKDVLTDLSKNLVPSSPEEYAKKMGWKEDPRFFGILGTRYVDSDGNKYTKEDVKKMIFKENNESLLNSSTNMFSYPKIFNGLASLQEKEQNEYNNKKLNLNNAYQTTTASWYKNGGNIKFLNGGFLNKFKVGSESKPEGVITLDNLLPIQAEIGELFVLPDYNTVQTNATKRHSKMPSDLVTDISPENTYVLSRHGDTKIYKDEASQEIVEVNNMPYKINGRNPLPITKALSDFMKKSVESPAEVGNKIIKKYKVDPSPRDAFSQNTNNDNMVTRSKYLDSLITLSEKDMERKGLTSSGTYLHGGYLKDRNIGKYGGGGAAVLGSVLGAGASLWSDWRNRKLIKENTADSLKDLDKTYSEQSKLSDVGLMSGLAGFASQNPIIDPVINSSSFLDSMITRSPRQYTDYNIQNLYANKPDFSAYSPQEAAILQDRFYAQAQGAQSDFAYKMGADNINRKNNYLTEKQKIQMSNEGNIIEAGNLTRANSNNLLAGAFGAISGNSTDRINLLSNYVSGKLAARGQLTSGLIKLNSDLAQNINNSVATGLQAYTSYLNNKKTNSTSQDIGSQNFYPDPNLPTFEGSGRPKPTGGLNDWYKWLKTR